ncbi:MAG: radical SAM protein [Archangiaceae bacterium]|nr:radical SAM protein [Archangiaceae bacterium]
MSALGFQTVYRAINQRQNSSAERVFLPDDVEAWKKARAPLFTLETQREVSTFDALAFSVAYELELPGLFTLLELAGLPVLSAERDARHPLVVAGGPLTFSNPEPLEPFVDVLVQGEAEDVLPTLLEGLEARTPKRELLERLARLPGFRVPGLSPDSTRFFVAKASDAMLPARSQIITANTELRSMFLIEPERGCSRGCHYCVMRRTTNGGMRTVPPELVLELIPPHARRVGLVGAAVTDHPRIAELLETLVASGREVGVSSLRADRLNARIVNALKAGGARGITVASDGASQRLRDMVDRKHSEQQIVHALELAKAAGMARAKVYNVVGLPTEEDADIDELVRFTLELSKILPISLGVAPFAAKRNTPMDGSPFAGIDQIEAKLSRIKKGLKGRAELRPTSARWAWVEYLLAQSGPEGGLAARDAWRSGASFAAWKRAFAERGVKPYLARRTEDGRRKSVTWPMVAPP